MDEELSDKLIGALGVAAQNKWTLKESKNWARKTRRRNENGHTRLYRCNGLPKVEDLELEIRTNPADTQIQYFAFKVKGKVVDGGVCSIASVLLDGSKNKARVAASQVKTKDKVKGFRKMTQDEINKLNTLTEFGDGFDMLFEERVAEA